MLEYLFITGKLPWYLEIFGWIGLAAAVIALIYVVGIVIVIMFRRKG